MTIQRWEIRNGFRGEDAYKHEDGPYVWYTDHQATVARYEAREKLWREYRDLLLEEVNAHVGLAVAHGWAGSPERYARGKTLRAALGIDKEGA